MPAVPARLIVIRHGQSTWNAQGRWQGNADPPLSELGEAQAAEAAAGLAGEAIEAVISSPLRRAHRTAQIIAEHLGLAAPDVRPEWMERHVGEFTGLTRAEIDQRWPGILDGPGAVEPPGGELRADFTARIRSALDRALEEFAGRTVAVVAHGGVVRAIEECCGAERGPIPNLVAWWLHGVPGAPGPGQRRLLIDPDSRNHSMPLAP